MNAKQKIKMFRPYVDDLNAACQKMYGHDNWTYLSSIKHPKKRRRALRESDCMIVVFWKKPLSCDFHEFRPLQDSESD